MRALSSHSSRSACHRSPRGAQLHWPQQQNHCPQRLQRLHSCKATLAPDTMCQQSAPEGDKAAEQQPSSTQQPEPAQRLSKLADTLGSAKAFVSEDEWRVMDQKVNKYPCQRVFNAIGTGGDDFKASMLKAVQDVVGTVHVECVSERPSSGGKYLSVRVGPVWVESADQVVQVFRNMREDPRLKWYM